MDIYIFQYVHQENDHRRDVERITSCSAFVFTASRHHTPAVPSEGGASETLSVLSGVSGSWAVAGGEGVLLLNEVLPLVVSGRALRVRLAVEGKVVTVFRLRRFDFLVPVRLFPAADDPGGDGQRNHRDENGHCYYS